MKKIICTTDFKEKSTASLRYAFELSRMLQSELTVLYVCDVENDEDYHSSSNTESVINNHQQLLEEFCSLNLNDKFENLDITATVINGKNIAQKILSFIKDLNFQFLVMGTRDSSTFKPLTFGSITNKMIESSPVPILAIPPTCKFKEPKIIVYTSDFEEDDIYNLKELVKIFDPQKSKIIVLHIYAYEEHMKHERLIGFQTLLAEKVSLDNFYFELIFSHNTFKSLQTFINDSNADIVAMMQRKNKSEFKNMIHKDLVKKMDNNTHIPLLSFNTVY